MASHAMVPDGWGRPLAAAHASNAAPAGTSRNAPTKSGLVCGPSTCVEGCDDHINVPSTPPHKHQPPYLHGYHR